MTLSAAAIAGPAANRAVLACLATRRLVPWPLAEVPADCDPHPLDEGGRAFVERYGRGVPDKAKYAVGPVRLFVHDRSGEIFAVHWGRLTIVVRYDATRADFDDDDTLRAGDTPDGWVDVRDLGPGWALSWAFADDLEDALTHAWEAAHARHKSRQTSQS